jgi:hypothetical protein
MKPPIKGIQRMPMKSGVGGVRWVVIMSLVVLVLCMILPAILSLSMQFELHATRVVTPQDLAQNYALEGSIEKLDTVTSTDYTATFVPSHLTTRSVPFAVLEVFYGPVLLTGVSINMVPNEATRGAGFTGYGDLSFTSAAPVVLFYILLIALFVILNWLYASHTEVLKFMIGLSFTWLIYTVIVSLLSGPLTGAANDVLNQVLGRTTNPLHFAPLFWGALGAMVRVFFVGMLFWVAVYLGRRAKVEVKEIEKSEQP